MFDSDKFSEHLLTTRCAVLRISMRDAAKQIGISTATLCRIENRGMPDVNTFYKACNWLQMPMQTYFTIDNAIPNQPEAGKK